MVARPHRALFLAPFLLLPFLVGGGCSFLLDEKVVKNGGANDGSGGADGSRDGNITGDSDLLDANADGDVQGDARIDGTVDAGDAGSTCFLHLSGHMSCVTSTADRMTCWGPYNPDLFNPLEAVTNCTTECRPTATRTTVKTFDAANGSYCLLYKDGHVSCAGNDESGQLGIGDTQLGFQNSVVKINGFTAKEIALGSNFACAIDLNRDVFCWGDNRLSQLGPLSNPTLSTCNGVAQSCAISPQKTLVGNALKIVASRSHACAIVDGPKRVVCWGDNSQGIFGDGGGPASATPHAITLPTSAPVDDLVLGHAIPPSGGEHACALAESKVYCWGASESLQAGDSGSSGIMTPPTEVKIAELLGVPIGISAGSQFSCAFTTEGKSLCWGLNGNYQLGVGNGNNRDVPLEVPGVGAPVQIASGYTHSCAVTNQGEVYCWGMNQSRSVGVDGGPSAATKVFTCR